MKSNYEDLLNAPLPTPSNSYSLVKDDEHVNKPSFTEEEYEKDLQFIPAHRTREALFELLQKENADLSKQLENTLERRKVLDRKNAKKARQLEAQVSFLQKSLDHATSKIQELEEYRKKKTLTKDSSTKLSIDNNGSVTIANNEDETLGQKWLDENFCYKDLLNQHEQLKLENAHVMKSKAEVETKLAASVQNMRSLQQQFEEFQLSVQDHDELKRACEAQQIHIEELNKSLEEHRLMVTNLRERAIHVSSALSSSCSSISSEDGIYTQKIREDNTKREDLLTELENAWFKHQSSPPRTRQTSSAKSTKASILDNPIQTVYDQLPNVDLALESIIVKAGVVEKDAIDDALSLLGRLENEYDHEKFLKEKRYIYYNDDSDYLDKYFSERSSARDKYYEQDEDLQICLHGDMNTLVLPSPPSGILGFVKNIFQSIVFSTWRWFRFSIIMTIAVLLSIKDGPDGL